MGVPCITPGQTLPNQASNRGWGGGGRGTPKQNGSFGNIIDERESFSADFFFFPRPLCRENQLRNCAFSSLKGQHFLECVECPEKIDRTTTYLILQVPYEDPKFLPGTLLVRLYNTMKVLNF